MKFLFFSLLLLVGANAHAQFDQMVHGQNIMSQAQSTVISGTGPHSAFCGLVVMVVGKVGRSPVLAYGVKNNLTFSPITNAAAVNYCTSSGLYQNPTLKSHLMAEAAIYYPNVCGKTFAAYNAGTSGAVGKKPFGWSIGGTIQFTWAAPACVASPTLSCADPYHSPAFNVGTTSSNNVPVSMCYINTAGACVYNTANPATATGAWNAACPSNVASTDCCRWKKLSPTGCVDSGAGNIQITSTSITNYPGLTASSSYYGKVTVNYKNIGGTFCKAPVFSFFYKAIFSNFISNGGPTSTLSTTLANQTGTTTWQFGREQTGVDCATTHVAKNTQIEVGITPTTSSHLILPVTVQCQ